MPFSVYLAIALDWQQMLGFASLFALGVIVALLKFKSEAERPATLRLTAAAVALTLVTSYSLLKTPAHHPLPGQRDPAAVFFPDVPPPVHPRHLKLA